MCRIVPSNAYNLARFHRSRKPHLLDRPGSFSSAPLFPRCLGDFFDLMAFHQSIKRRSVRSARVCRIKTAEFHSWKARLVLAMGNVIRTHFPDDRTNPGKRRKDKISHRPQHKNVKTAVVLAQLNKFDAQQQIRNRQKTPAEHPRSKQVQRRTVEAHYRYASKKDQKANRRNVPLSREDFELRHPVRRVHPEHKNRREAHPRVSPRPYGCASEEAEAVGCFAEDWHGCWTLPTRLSNPVLPGRLRYLGRSCLAWHAFVPCSIHRRHRIPVPMPARDTRVSIGGCQQKIRR